ncbi:MAG: LacI family transcriptional regulator [Blastochloris sp.]|nr:LacI family transcriptional regulator [Blastochloris sp.]
MSDPVKMSDIARLAGVSVSTVSRALNNNTSIPERTRQRIHQIAHDLNYHFDVRAQNFRLQRSTTVALVFPYRGTSQRLILTRFTWRSPGQLPMRWRGAIMI